MALDVAVCVAVQSCSGTSQNELVTPGHFKGCLEVEIFNPGNLVPIGIAYFTQRDCAISAQDKINHELRGRALAVFMEGKG